MAGIYVHIPFCLSRCAYCDFYSTTRAELCGDYVRALVREIGSRSHEQLAEGKAVQAPVRTIYFGGGTPSVLPLKHLDTIVSVLRSSFDIADDAEATIEMNPEDLCTGEYACGHEPLTHLRDLFNRVSLGVQTFNDEVLRLIRRRHSAEHAVAAVQALKDAGFRNISVDLIYGLPGQDMSMWERDVDLALSLGVQHLSAYALSYESGTALTRWRNEGRVKEVDEELSVAMYEILCRKAHEAGFEHYEISNFALPGYRSRHNSSYWIGTPYMGFGPAAHSYDGMCTRRANAPGLDDYLAYWLPSESSASYKSSRKQERGTLQSQPATFEHLTGDDLYDEVVMCGLRTSDGIDLDAIVRRFGHERRDYLLRMAAPHVSAGRLVHTDGRIIINEKSLMTSDDIMSDLMS